LQINVRSGTLRFPLPGSVVASNARRMSTGPEYVRLYSGTLEPGVHQIHARFEKATKIPMRSSALSLLLATCPFHIALTCKCKHSGQGYGSGYGYAYVVPTHVSRPPLLAVCWTYFAVDMSQKEGTMAIMASSSTLVQSTTNRIISRLAIG
jgi:hypothetical protein